MASNISGGNPPSVQTAAVGQFVVPLSYSNSPKMPYEGNLDQLDQNLQTILNLPEGATNVEKGANLAQKKALLQKSYSIVVEELKRCPNPEKPPAELAMRLCDIMRQYGQIVYSGELDDNFPIARQMEFAALNAGDYAIGILDKMFNFSQTGFEKLEDYPSFVAKSKPFEFMDRHVLDHSPDFCASRPALNHLSGHALFVLAYNRRWLNGSCRNVEDPKESPQTRILRYTNLIDTADKLLNIQFTSENKDELWELDYNDKPGFFKFMMEHDPANRQKWKEAYDKNWVDLEKLANQDDGKICRVINKMSFDIKDPAEREVQLRKAYDRHPTKDGTHFCIVLNNLGRTVMELRLPKLEEADDLLTRAKAIVDAHRASGFDNVNFTSIDLNYQLIKAVRADAKGELLHDFQIAVRFVNEAIEKVQAEKFDDAQELVTLARPLTEKYPSLLAFVRLEATMKRIDARILEQKNKS